MGRAQAHMIELTSCKRTSIPRAKARSSSQPACLSADSSMRHTVAYSEDPARNSSYGIFQLVCRYLALVSPAPNVRPGGTMDRAFDLSSNAGGRPFGGEVFQTGSSSLK